MDLENKIRLNELYDIYGELLTDKQRTYFDYYYLKDYSLSEISELLKVSRNAVHMQLKNVVKHLENYEEKLKILDKNEKINSILKKIDRKELSIEDIKNKLEKV